MNNLMESGRAEKGVLALIIVQLLIVVVIFGLMIFNISKGFVKPKAGEPVKAAKPVSCREGDVNCITKNSKNLANQIEGSEIKFARHQCDGPHPCPTPDAAKITADTAIIADFAKDPSISVVPVNGVNSFGIIYYCTKSGRCWEIDSKANKVLKELKI